MAEDPVDYSSRSPWTVGTVAEASHATVRPAVARTPVD